jgi:hypothetical protein
MINRNTGFQQWDVHLQVSVKIINYQLSIINHQLSIFQPRIFASALFISYLLRCIVFAKGAISSRISKGVPPNLSRRELSRTTTRLRPITVVGDCLF